MLIIKMQTESWSTNTEKSALFDTTKTGSRSSNTQNISRSANIRQVFRVAIKTIHFAKLVIHIMDITSGQVNTRLSLRWAIHRKSQQQTVGRITIYTYLIGRQIHTMKSVWGETLRGRSCWQTRKAAYCFSNNVHTVNLSINHMKAAHWPPDIQISIPLYKME